LAFSLTRDLQNGLAKVQKVQNQNDFIIPTEIHDLCHNKNIVLLRDEVTVRMPCNQERYKGRRGDTLGCVVRALECVITYQRCGQVSGQHAAPWPGGQALEAR
jgi:hypothetical protein